MPRKDFINPTFKGVRFDEHELPVDVLGEFKAYSDLVLALAKHLYMVNNPSRQKVPKGFAKQLQLRITSVGKGSVAVKVDRFFPDESQDFGEFEQARDIVNSVISNPASSTLPADFPKDLLGHFVHFGKSLEDDEVIELAVPGVTPGNPVIYNKQRRFQLITSDRIAKQSAVLLSGRVTNVDLTAKRFTLTLGDDAAVSGPYRNEIAIPLRDAHRQSESSETILVAKGLTFADKTVLRIEDIQHMVVFKDGGLLFSLPELSKKAEEIKSLPAGWLDGEGRAFAPTFVDSVVGALRTFLELKKLPFPYLYPTPEGSIQAEWSFGSWEVSLLFEENSAALHAANILNEETIENKFDHWDSSKVQEDIANYLVETFIEVSS